MYPGLTNGAAAALATHGGDELKQRYLPKMTTGEWTATMNLTEPHCGTDLGLIKTRATRQPDGSYLHHRTEDLHLGRRARPRRQHHPSRAGAHRRRAGRDQGHLAVRRAEASGRRRRLARRAQRRRLRLDRAQDGHPRQFDLRAQLRRRQGLAGRRREPRPQRDVRDDERGAARRRRAGPEPVRGRLSERRRLRQGAPAGPLADRRRRRPTSRPTRSSSIPTCGACCSKSAPSTRRRAR